MELRDYIKLYWRQRVFIGLIVVGATILTWIIASTRPERTAASLSFAISRVNKEQTSDYQYDGYYALQASDLFAQTVVSWFSTPSILQEVYLSANLDPSIDSIHKLPSRFHVKKFSAQNIVVRFTEASNDRAAKIVQAIKTVMEQRTEQLNRNADGKSIFAIVGTDPVISPERPNAPVLSVAALVISFGLALIMAAARHYLRT